MRQSEAYTEIDSRKCEQRRTQMLIQVQESRDEYRGRFIEGHSWIN